MRKFIITEEEKREAKRRRGRALGLAEHPDFGMHWDGYRLCAPFGHASDARKPRSAGNLFRA